MQKKHKFQNPFVQHLISKKQGPMGPTRKQAKKRDKQEFKKAMKSATYE